MDRRINGMHNASRSILRSVDRVRIGHRINSGDLHFLIVNTDKKRCRGVILGVAQSVKQRPHIDDRYHRFGCTNTRLPFGITDDIHIFVVIRIPSLGQQLAI